MNHSVPKIVVVGGGFAGVQAVRKLKSTGASITLIDKNNYSLFQPFLYQVATSILSGEQIGVPLRTIFKNAPNVEILMSEMTGIESNHVILPHAKVPFDYLILALGVQYNYFGNESWKEFAPSLKSVEDADYLRRKILGALEKAETESDPETVKKLMTFVLVGGGPTGVEMAGTLAALTKTGMLKNFRRIDPRNCRVILLEAGPRILATFHPDLGKKAESYLQKEGVEVHTGSRVMAMDASGVSVNGQRIDASNIIWTAGVKVPFLGQWLKAPSDSVGRILVKGDLSVPNHPNIFVVGDAAHFEQKGKSLPGVAQVALQQGRYVAKVIREKIKGQNLKESFHYFDKGNMAIVGKAYAVAELPLDIRVSGLFAWVIWAIVHVIYNFNLKNRMSVVSNWVWTFLTKTTTVRLMSTSTSPFQQPGGTSGQIKK